MFLREASYWIERLHMVPHPEGGYFVENFSSKEKMETFDGRLRKTYSSIYFLLEPSSPSHFHRLKSDEVWYYHAGDPLTVHIIHLDGVYEAIEIGPDLDAGQKLSTVVPAGAIFGSSVYANYALVSCVVSPGFEYEDFELFTQAELLADYPQHEQIIRQLAYENMPKESEND
nr:cupin domain-containing protein [Salicibibacter kimchii]